MPLTRPQAMALMLLLSALPRAAAAQQTATDPTLQAICAADSADRVPLVGRRRTPAEWREIAIRDSVRLLQVRDLYSTGRLAAPQDLFCAAVIFQHSSDPANDASDLLAAHELALLAALAGVPDARYLVAASEDRLLRRLGRPQRFGTQWEPDSAGRFSQAPVDGLMPDQVRSLLGLPALERLRQSPGGR